MNTQWWKDAVAYQIYPRSFMDANGDGIGDLQGVISKLDYLKDLGIDVIWLSPVYSSPNDDNGYDISDYHNIMEEFGTMEDFDELLKEVHQRGMKLIMDLVINHTSDEHAWFVESRESKQSPKRDWYIWRKGLEGKEPNNWESIFGGSAWEYDEATKEYYLHLFSKKQPDLNWENEEVRENLYDMVNWWLDKGIDGYRIDAISHIKKAEGLPDIPNPDNLKYVPSFCKHMNQPGILDLLQELNERTFKGYDIMTVGEANGVMAEESESWVGENGAFNMVFEFEHLSLWEEAEENKVKNEVKEDDELQEIDEPKKANILHVKKALSKWQDALYNKGWNALFLENHDLPRVVSRLGNDKEYWKESAKALGVMYFMMQGTPFIYQGQEIGMTNIKLRAIEEYNDIQTKGVYTKARENGLSHEEAMEIVWNDTRDNSRTAMQWSNSLNGGFSEVKPWFAVNPNYTKINVEDELKDEDSVLNFYKKMICVKKTHTVFKDGKYELVLKDDQDLFVYKRTDDKESAIVICNLSATEREYSYEAAVLEYDALLLSNIEVKKHEALTKTVLKPYEARVYKLSK